MFRNIHVALSASSGNLRSVLAAGAADVKMFEKGVESSGSAVGKFADIAQKAVKVGAIGLAAGLALSATSAISFEREMRNVTTLTGQAGRDLESLSRQTLAMAKDPFISQGPVELAKGLYDVASSGFQGAQGLMILRTAAEAASAGLTTTAVSGKAITSVLNAYGRSAVDASDVSDVLFQTVNLGVITFEELASQIGDVVGAAAAAGVPIEDVGAAIAAMTLSGVSAAESTTSLNQVLQALIKPSDAMAATLRNLGFESGAAAIEELKLSGVMEELRNATGGQLTAMQLLFPEIRGLRGALALTAAAGENYRKTTAGIAVEEARAGATRKALAEQAKGVGFQLDQMRNRATVAAIAVGTLLLPAIQSLLRGLQDFAARAWPAVQAGFDAALPLFRNLAEIGMNVVEVAKELLATLAPVGKALATLVGGTVLVGLNAIATLISNVTGFLADNAEIVTFLVTLYGVSLVASLAKAAIAFGALALERVAVGMYNTAGSVTALASSFTVAQAAAVGLAVGLTATSLLYSNVEKHAREAANEITKDFDLSNSEALGKAIMETSAAFEELKAQSWDDKGSFWSQANTIKGFFQDITFWTKNTVSESRATAEALEQDADKMLKSRVNAWANETELMKVTGLSRQQVIAYAKTVGIDLTKAFDSSAEAREKVILSFQKMQQETGLSAQKLTELTSGGPAQWEALQAAINETAKAVGEAFGKATAIFDDTGLKAAADAAKDVASAADRLATSEERVASSRDSVVDAAAQVAKAEKEVKAARAGTPGDAEQIRDAEDRLASAREAAAKAGATPAEIRAVANAERDLARIRAGEAADPEKIADAETALQRARRDLKRVMDDQTKATKDAKTAQEELNKAQISPADKLRASFQEKLDITTTFVAGIGELTKRGLDPGLIKQLLEQGPKDAAPTIEALLSDHTGTLVGMANETEVQLQAVNARVVTFARLTQVAVSSETDKLVTALPLAMKVAGQALASEGKATAEQIALAIGAPTDQVREVATAYGITIGAAIGKGIGQGVNNSVASIEARGFVIIPGGGKVMATGGIERFAEGGMRDVAPHIATQPTILFGERSTGGEAYIPLGQQHRTRSTMLWEETGRILGVRAMADGGVFPRGRQAASYAAPPPQVIVQQVPTASGAPVEDHTHYHVEAPLDAGLVRQIEYAGRVNDWRTPRSGRK
jgi:TP901 family phage tail tape measure protein